MHTYAQQESCAIAKMTDRAMLPMYGCPENFRDSLTMPTATFPKILWAFVPMVPSERALVSSYRLSIHIIPLSALVCPKF